MRIFLELDKVISKSDLKGYIGESSKEHFEKVVVGGVDFTVKYQYLL